MAYHLPDGYRSQTPEVYSELGDDTHWQPEVYSFAAQVARAEGAARIVDFGCSTAGKLLALADEFDVVGVDLAANISTDPRGTWIVHDLDRPGNPPLRKSDLHDAIVVCSDVIEHMDRPEHLVAKLRYCLRWALALVLSTPDRTRTRGPDMGPPANRCHAREWDADELVGWLESEGLTVEEQIFQPSYRGGPEATTVVVCR